MIFVGFFYDWSPLLNFRLDAFTALCLIVLRLIMAEPSSAFAQSATDCSNQVSIMDLRGVLYKPVNEHGGRGPSFLVQNPIERTGKKRLEIRDVNCKLISRFGLYATDFPFGARYYEKSGGGKHDAKALLKLAKKAGSRSILVQGVDGKWIVVRDPTRREGKIYG
jgi:hypothetical protein